MYTTFRLHRIELIWRITEYEKQCSLCGSIYKVTWWAVLGEGLSYYDIYNVTGNITGIYVTCICGTFTGLYTPNIQTRLTIMSNVNKLLGRNCGVTDDNLVILVPTYSIYYNGLAPYIRSILMTSTHPPRCANLRIGRLGCQTGPLSVICQSPITQIGLEAAWSCFTYGKSVGGIPSLPQQLIPIYLPYLLYMHFHRQLRN